MIKNILNDKWLPTSVNQIKSSLIFECNDVLKSNIAYNLQYLEYIMHLDQLEKENDNYSTSVIMKMRYKSFVIVALGIIESIFISLLETNKLLPYDYRKTNIREEIINENDTRVTYIRRKTTKYKRLNFDEIINLMENNNILNIGNDNYSLLTQLKKLRNKVHLEKANTYIESDYNSFNHIIYNQTKTSLYSVLTSPVVSSPKYNLYLDKFNSFK